MTPITRLLATAALAALLVVALAGCGGGDDGEAAQTGTGPVAGEDFDRAFIDAMVPHHESAIEMARMAKEAGLVSPELGQVADDILATQQDEIDRMKEWREEWFGSAEIDPDGAAALGMDEAEMGMQHDADALAEAEDVDAEFAAMMIDHHAGAIAMAKLAEGRAEHEEIEELARAIIDAQEREIAVLEPHATAGMEHHSG